MINRNKKDPRRGRKPFSQFTIVCGVLYRNKKDPRRGRKPSCSKRFSCSESLYRNKKDSRRGRKHILKSPFNAKLFL